MMPEVYSSFCVYTNALPLTRLFSVNHRLIKVFHLYEKGKNAERRQFPWQPALGLNTTSII